MTFRVLVDSPDPVARQSLVRGLRRDAFKVLPACPAGSAVGSVLEKEPDILVLDIDRGPCCTGEMILELRKARPHLRIIVLGKSSSVEHADILDGVFTYMTKPVGKQLAEVVEAAGRALARRQVEEESRS